MISVLMKFGAPMMDRQKVSGTSTCVRSWKLINEIWIINWLRTIQSTEIYRLYLSLKGVIPRRILCVTRATLSNLAEFFFTCSDTQKYTISVVYGSKNFSLSSSLAVFRFWAFLKYVLLRWIFSYIIKNHVFLRNFQRGHRRLVGIWKGIILSWNSTG